jgi:hypothetical protein
MKEIMARLLDKDLETRPDALTLLSIPEIWQEAIKIQSKVAEADIEMGAQL